MRDPFYIPRPGTRARAVFNQLLTDYVNRQTTSWSDAKSAYDDKSPSYKPATSLSSPRRWSSMEVSRLLKRYADRVSRGVYTLKAKFVGLSEIRDLSGSVQLVRPWNAVCNEPGCAECTSCNCLDRGGPWACACGQITDLVSEDARFICEKRIVHGVDECVEPATMPEPNRPEDVKKLFAWEPYYEGKIPPEELIKKVDGQSCHEQPASAPCEHKDVHFQGEAIHCSGCGQRLEDQELATISRQSLEQRVKELEEENEWLRDQINKALEALSNTR